MNETNHSALAELNRVEDLIAQADRAGAIAYAGGRLMMAGLHQRRTRVLSEHLDAYLAASSELLDISLTRAATHGTGGEISLLARVLAPFQDSLASIAQSAIGRPTARGQLPGTIQDSVALRVAVALPGSLHLRLVPAVPESQEPLFDGANSLLELSMESLVAIMSAQGSREDTLQSIASAGPRAATHVHTLAKVLAEGHADLGLRWRSPRASYEGRLDSRRAAELRQLLEDFTEEVRTRVFVGRMVGGNLIRKTFELQLGDADDGSVISGKVVDSALGDLEILFGELCTATVEVRESSLQSGETKEHFTLLSLD